MFNNKEVLFITPSPFPFPLSLPFLSSLLSPSLASQQTVTELHLLWGTVQARLADWRAGQLSAAYVLGCLEVAEGRGRGKEEKGRWQ